MTTKRKSLKAWQRLLIGVDLDYAEIDAALERANTRFQDTTGLVDTKGRYLRKPRISKGRKGIAQSQYYSWSKEILEAGKKRLAGDTAREANTGEVQNLRRETRDLKEVVAEQTLELRLLKKSMIGDGEDIE